jgi:DNA-binding YbaB/EbfC family protein
MFKGGMGNVGNLMKMAKQLQAEALKLKKEVEEKEFTSSAGGGAVKVVVKGSGEVVKIEISPELIESKDIEMIQDLITVAVNQALKQSKEALEKAMSGIAGGLDLGGLF